MPTELIASFSSANSGVTLVAGGGKLSPRRQPRGLVANGALLCSRFTATFLSVRWLRADRRSDGRKTPRRRRCKQCQAVDIRDILRAVVVNRAKWWRVLRYVGIACDLPLPKAELRIPRHFSTKGARRFTNSRAFYSNYMVLFRCGSLFLITTLESLQIRRSSRYVLANRRCSDGIGRQSVVRMQGVSGMQPPWTVLHALNIAARKAEIKTTGHE